MSRTIIALLATVLVTVFHLSPASAQQIKMFDSQEALDAEITKHMAAGSFTDLIEVISPPSRTSLGRMRILEKELPEDFPSLTQSVPIFRNEPADGVSRGITGWWDGKTYVYLGLFLHMRDDGVAVLDFLLTGSINRASRWYLMAD